jgi:F-type H+-transporting ATPase subunit b
MDSFISAFHIDFKILIAQAINFGIIFAVLYFFALKPLKKIMAERTGIIEKGISDAKENAALIANTQKEYEATIAKAREEAHAIFQAGKADAEVRKAEMIRMAQDEVNRMVDQGKKNLETEKIKMVDEAKKEIVSLVVSATEKLLADQSNSSITEKTIKNIKKA